MKVILDMAISLNGMVARLDGSEDWLPHEGWVEFVEQAKLRNNIVVGRETYDKVTELYKDHNFDDVDVEHKIIVTRDTSFYIEGYVTVNTPLEAVEYLTSKDVGELYLIGGGVLNSSFVKQKLVTDIHLTINPYLLGEGRPFVFPGNFEAQLTLKSSERLSNGRMRMLYKVNQ